jgi:acyl carrier protein
MELEKEFGMSIPDDQAEKISTVKDAVDYISNNVK